MIITTSLVLVAIIGFSKGMQDRAMKTKNGFNPMGKYHKDKIPVYQIESTVYRKYHEFFNLSYKEKFPFSATALVSLSDAWHFYGLIGHLALIALTVINIGTWGLLVPVLRSIGFHTGYTFTNK